MNEWRSAQSGRHPPLPSIYTEQFFDDCAPGFPVYQGKYREFFDSEGLEAPFATKSRRDFKSLRGNSLRKGAGNFLDQTAIRTGLSGKVGRSGTHCRSWRCSHGAMVATNLISNDRHAPHCGHWPRQVIRSEVRQELPFPRGVQIVGKERASVAGESSTPCERNK